MITILNDLRKQLDLLEKDNIDLYKKELLIRRNDNEIINKNTIIGKFNK